MAAVTRFRCLQTVMDVMVHPVAEEEAALLEAGLDVPEPMFPGNNAREASVCLINADLKCAFS